jgi:hypothetical protein
MTAGNSDLDELRARFPGWHIDSRWITVPSSPDRRLFWAIRGDRKVAAWSATELAAMMTAEKGKRLV